MKKNRIITNILAIALVLIAVIIVVITVGLFKTTKEETLEGQAETTVTVSLPKYLHAYWS